MARGCQERVFGRRQFVRAVGMAGLGVLGACGPWLGQPPPPRVYRVGWLVNPQVAEAEAFWPELRAWGYAEGHNLMVERRWSAQADLAALDALAAELVGRQVDVIVVSSTPGALAVKRATSTVPIVFTSIADPVGSGLVPNLARPGGNATGLSDFGLALSSKRLELLRDTVPQAGRIGVIWPSTNPAFARQWHEMENAAATLGVQVVSLALDDEGQLDAVLELASRGRTEALIVLGTPESESRAIARATALRLPTLIDQPSVLSAGGLIAYGPNRVDMWRRAAHYVDRVLQGTRPAALPIEQPMTFDLVVNLQTAQALGLMIPQHVLLQATEILR